MEKTEVNQAYFSRTKKLIDEVAASVAKDPLNIPREWEEFSVFISISPALSGTYAGQLMLMSSVNLIARFCNNVNLEESLRGVPTKIAFPFGSSETLLETCLEIAREVNPSVRVHAVSSRPEGSIALGIGSEADIVIASDNWFSYLNCRHPQVDFPESQNPFGPLFASCLGGAEVFRKLISRLGAKGSIAGRVLPDIRFSTLDYSCNDPMAINPAFPETIDLGKVLFTGSGAVANGAAAALYFIDSLSGYVSFLDDQDIDVSNVGRYYLISLPDVGTHKAHKLVQVFKDSKLSVNPLPGSLESFSAGQIRDYDIVVSALDNRNHHGGRIYLQNILPKRVIHAATQGLAVAVASIDFLDGACLGCLFSPRAKEIMMVPNDACGGVTIQLEDNKGFAAAVSFVSAASGILASSELIKNAVPELRSFALNNYFSLSLMSPDLVDVHFRQKDPNCVCLCSESIRHEAYKAKYSIKNN